MDDEKYAVFKREAAQWTSTGAHYNAEEALADACVIRTQDLFAAAGLQAYAEVIRTGVALAEQLGGVHRDDLDRLFEVAEYFEQRASEAADRRANGESKLPG